MRVLRAVAEAHKSHYTEEDLAEVRRLIKEIDEGFPERGQVIEVEKEGMFNSGTEEVWEHPDGHHVELAQDYDPKTGEDRYGFTRDETRPEDAIAALKEIQSVLQQ